MVSINTKFVILAVLLVAIPGIILGVVGYKAAQTAVYKGVDDRLQDQAHVWKLLIEETNKEIALQEKTDPTYRATKTEELKNLIAKQVVGKTGYIWVLDSKGNYIVSKNRLRDGENLWNSKDTNGVLFIQEAIAKAKTAGDGTSIEVYPWLNKGEKTPRLKAAGLAYVSDTDWVIGVSSYYDDFSGQDSLGAVKNTLLTVGIISIILGILLAFLLASMVSTPLRRMAKAGNEVGEGKLDTQLPTVKTGDEVEEIGNTMTLLVGAIKFLKNDAAKKQEPAKKESAVKKKK